MLEEGYTRSVVYQVLDQVLADENVASSSRAAMFSVIDALRQSCAPVEELRRAESISIEMHKLDWALLQGDADQSEASLGQLKSLASSWLNSRICG